MNDRELAARLIAIRVMKDWLSAEDRRLREQAGEALMVGERVSGALDPADKETLLGFVQLTKPRESVSVTDKEAFTEWVAAVAPSELVEIPARTDVRSSFVQAVLNEVKAHGGWISPNGELLSPDGVEVTTGQPIITVKPTAEADGLVRDALAGGRLQLMPGELS